MKKVLKRSIIEELEKAVGERPIKKVRKEVLTAHAAELVECTKEENKSLFQKALDLLVKKGKVILVDSKFLKINKVVTSDEIGDLDDSKRTKKRRKERVTAEIEGIKGSNFENLISDAAHGAEAKEAECEASSKFYPDPAPATGDVTILLFYAYCVPQMTRAEQDKAIAYCYGVLSENKITGRLRIAREGYNCTLTGRHDSIRAFTSKLKEYDPRTFAETDFKYVDNLPENQLLKGLKVFPVQEIVTYGFNPNDAPLDKRGTHLKPEEFHAALEDPQSVVIDVRNFNETAIGKFRPPGDKVLDPCMRRSTEFPKWIEDNRDKLEGKKVLMYCTAGVRCERASAFMRNKGIENVYQLEGGIHRYLDAFPEDGGHWVGKNYTFDKRFSHGAEKSTVISLCVHCAKQWDRYQAQKKCFKCKMEVLLCRECQRSDNPPANSDLLCPLCSKR